MISIFLICQFIIERVELICEVIFMFYGEECRMLFKFFYLYVFCYMNKHLFLNSGPSLCHVLQYREGAQLRVCARLRNDTRDYELQMYVKNNNVDEIAKRPLLTCLLAYLLIYLLTPWSRVFLEKLTASQLVKKFPAFYGTRRFITALTSARQLSIS